MSKADLSEIPQYVKNKISNTLTGRYCGVDSPSNKYSEEIILSLINDLMDVNNTYEFLSEKYSVPYSFVGAIATHRIWKHLTENITFPKRKSTRTYCKLNEEKVCEIIQYILDGYQNRDIAEIYGVTPRKALTLEAKLGSFLVSLLLILLIYFLRASKYPLTHLVRCFKDILKLSGCSS